MARRTVFEDDLTGDEFDQDKLSVFRAEIGGNQVSLDLNKDTLDQLGFPISEGMEEGRRAQDTLVMILRTALKQG